MKFLFSLFVIMLSSSHVFAIAFDSITELRGNREFIDGKIAEADSLISSYSYIDSGYYYLKSADIEIAKGDKGRARYYLNEAIRTSNTYAPYAYRLLGDLELSDGMVDYAILAYRNGADRSELEPYKFFLYKKIDSLSDAYSDELGSIGWVTMWHSKMIGEKKPKDKYDSWVKVISDSGLTPKLYDSLYTVASGISQLKLLVKAVRDTSKITAPFSAKKSFLISKRCSKYGYNRDASNWLHYSMGQKDFSTTVNNKSYLTFRSDLNFTLKNWKASIKWGKEVMDKYGYSSNLIYNAARSYRKLGDKLNSDKWYSLHIKQYPNSKRSHNILWYQAWQQEDSQHYDSAIILFKNIAERYSNKKYGDDAGFRVGLLNYRLGNYSKAVDSFDWFKKKYSRSNLYIGADYWSGRSLLLKGDKAGAEKRFKAVVKLQPYNYYSWRSRKFLSKDYSVLPVADSAQEHKWDDWIDSISHQINDTLGDNNEDSIITIAVRLGTIGLSEESEFILENIEIRADKNYRLLINLSKFYNNIGLHYHGFKISKRIFYKIPRNMSNSLPRYYLEMIYPNVFAKEIKSASKKYNVEGNLVRGVMRQESMFSPTISSYVGARGLMQIMPYTGKEIASELSVNFDPAMLYVGETNINFGTYYLSTLLKKFGNNKVKAVASYNGGPHNVKKWVKRNKLISEEEPLFTEFIGFSETRNYAKRVLENYWMYGALYGDK